MILHLVKETLFPAALAYKQQEDGHLRKNCKKPLAIEVPRKSLVETRRIKCLENGGRHFRNILGALLGHEATEKRCKEKLAAAAPAISLGALRILCFCMLLCV